MSEACIYEPDDGAKPIQQQRYEIHSMVGVAFVSQKGMLKKQHRKIPGTWLWAAIEALEQLWKYYFVMIATTSKVMLLRTAAALGLMAKQMT
jgi:hypothetical protein